MLGRTKHSIFTCDNWKVMMLWKRFKHAFLSFEIINLWNLKFALNRPNSHVLSSKAFYYIVIFVLKILFHPCDKLEEHKFIHMVWWWFIIWVIQFHPHVSLVTLVVNFKFLHLCLFPPSCGFWAWSYRACTKVGLLLFVYL